MGKQIKPIQNRVKKLKEQQTERAMRENGGRVPGLFDGARG